MANQNIRPERLTRIENARLGDADACWHIGEYTSHGGYKASDTNSWINNLKKPPNATSGELYWKGQAIAYWAGELRRLMNMEVLAQRATLVPAPPSKLATNVLHDDRMYAVLQRMGRGLNLDIRKVLTPSHDRDAQHAGNRLTVAELE